ncbi:MAG: phosphatase PAP2 family protein [Elusimicrobiota bacterium]
MRHFSFKNALGDKGLFLIGLSVFFIRLSTAGLCDSSPSATDGDINLGYFENYFSDAKTLAASPLGWDGRDWARAGGVFAAAAGLYIGADVPAQHIALRNQSSIGLGFANAGQIFGNGFFVVPALGAAYLGGLSLKSSRLKQTASDGLESLVISGILVDAVKVSAGRSRPYAGSDRGRWNGPAFSNSEWSFPSGHSVVAFSVATVVASEYADSPFVPPAAYGAATLTALSRIYQNQHWASDVFVGGAVGYFAAKAVMRYHKRLKTAGGVLVIPVVGGRSAGLEIIRRFN